MTSSTSKQDLLSACLKDLGPNPPSLPEFQAAFCSRCFQRECSRSLAGTSLFEKRTSTWEERLFEHPELLPPEDPRFSEISSKKFVDITAYGGSLPILGRAQLPSHQPSWVDPREAPPPAATPVVQAPVQIKEAPPAAPLQEEVATKTLPVEAAPDQKITSPLETGVEKRDYPSERLPANTPFQPGTMVGSGPPPSKALPDEWAAKAPPPIDKETTILKPGTKFRFGR